MNGGNRLLSAILRQDAKQTSYKMALVRAVNDVALSYADLHHSGRDVAVPLRLLAEFWLAYYWPFMGDAPILQGARPLRDGVLRPDLSFRPALTELKRAWGHLYGVAAPADGFILNQDLKLSRGRSGYDPAFRALYDQTLRVIAEAVKQPIKYAGGGAGGGWRVFARPRRLADLPHAVPVPGTTGQDVCVVVTRDLWGAFQELSMWIEALCIHEWCLFSEGVAQDGGRRVSRGEVYGLLTERPRNRRPLTWERNQVELLMLEGYAFSCPWSRKPLSAAAFDLDHIVPVSVYPINELWNLVPSDPRTNMHLKRARLPSPERWEAAVPHLRHTYRGYAGSAALGPTLTHDATHRFSRFRGDAGPEALTAAVGEFVNVIAAVRNVAVF